METQQAECLLKASESFEKDCFCEKTCELGVYWAVSPFPPPLKTVNREKLCCRDAFIFSFLASVQLLNQSSVKSSVWCNPGVRREGNLTMMFNFVTVSYK